MVIDGLYRKGYHDLALEVAENHFNAVFEVWKNTGTFWEYYAPEKIEPGFMARKDFVGWAGLPPIAVFIEYILGIKSDYSEGCIVWDINHTEAHGIDRYPYGPTGNGQQKQRIFPFGQRGSAHLAGGQGAGAFSRRSQASRLSGWSWMAPSIHWCASSVSRFQSSGVRPCLSSNSLTVASSKHSDDSTHRRNCPISPS